MTNLLACIARCFLELEFLKVMLRRLYWCIIGSAPSTSTAKTYSKLIPVWQLMYKGAFTFVTDSQYTHSRYVIEVCTSIEGICEDYEPHVF